MTRVVFLIDVVDSYGEREQATQFARRIGRHEAVFVAAAGAAPHLRACGFVCHAYGTYADCLEQLARLEPELVVCSEWFNLPPPLRDGIARYRLATFDGTSLGVAINTNPFLEEPAPRTLDVPLSLVRLLPCPVNDPAPDDAREFHFALFPDLARGDRAAVRTEWNVPAHARLVVAGIAGWAARAAAAHRRMEHYQLLFSRLISAIHLTREPAHIIVVAPWAPETASSANIELRFVPHMPPDVYERLLLGSDLVVGDNTIQFSTAKAHMAGVPTLTVVDSTASPPWNIFPLAVRASTRSAYWRAIAPVELSDGPELVRRVASAWRDDPRDSEFRTAVAALRSPAAIVEALS